MNSYLRAVTLTAAMFLVHSSPLLATDGAPSAAGSQAVAKRTKLGDPIKPVDINGASKLELKQLPGLSDEDIDKIIAGRPYGSKVWLVTHNIIDATSYGAIKARIVARQPFKDAGKNAAIYRDRKPGG